MKLRWKAITCDAQRLLTKSQMWGKLWHATVQAGGWVGVRSGREKHLPGKTPQTAPPSQDLNVVNDATKVDPRAMAEPGSRYPEGDGPSQEHIFHMLPPPVFDHPSRWPHTNTSPLRTRAFRSRTSCTRARASRARTASRRQP